MGEEYATPQHSDDTPNRRKAAVIDQCNAIVRYGCDGKGNRAGLIPPRHCQRPATRPGYCGIHARQADLQDLLRQCLSPSWEIKVKLWHERRRRQELETGFKIAARLQQVALEGDMPALSAFLSVNSGALAQSWADETAPA